MNPFKWVGNLVTAIVNPVGEYFTEGQKIKAAKQHRKDELKKLNLEAKLESIKNSEKSNTEMDKEAENRIPWADDLTLVLFLLPFVLAFCPPALPHIQAGFEALDKMPEWYKYSIGMMLVSVWGYRNLVAPIVTSVTTAYLNRFNK